MTGVNTFDPSKAKQLLAAAGQDNLKLRLAQVSAFPYALRLTDILASQLQTIGVSLDVQPMEFPRWLQQVFTNAQDYDLTIINHVEERDIGNYANPKYYWHYDNPDVATQLKQADAEPDLAGRKPEDVVPIAAHSTLDRRRVPRRELETGHHRQRGRYQAPLEDRRGPARDQHSKGGEMPGSARDDDLGDAQFPRNHRRVQGPGATISDEGEIGGV